MTTRPNVLIILTDQLRSDCLGFAGNPDVLTPAIDGLVADGVNYPDAFCTAPLCTPSRYSLLTGLYPSEHGVHANRETLDEAVPTLPDLLKAVGYGTSAVGKMHLTPTYAQTGFDRMTLAEQDGDGRLNDDYHRELFAAGLMDGNDVIDQRPEYRDRANEHYWKSFGAAVSDVPEAWHSSTWIADKAIAEMDAEWSTGPQLMYLSFVKPHHPFDPPAPWDRMYRPQDLTVLPGWTESIPKRDSREDGHFPYDELSEITLREVMALYYGSISHLDAQIARVVMKLRELDAYDNTLILFTSDHGEYLGFHHMLLKHGDMYDPLVRVPLVVKYPDGLEAGTTDRRLASGVDVVPTVLHHATADRAAVALLPGEVLSDRAWSRSTVTTESATSGVMIRSDSQKMLVQGAQSIVFDLLSDPLELQPLSGEHADRELVVAAQQAAHRSPGEQSRSRRSMRDSTPQGVAATERMIAAGMSEHPWLVEPDKARSAPKA